MNLEKDINGWRIAIEVAWLTAWGLIDSINNTGVFIGIQYWDSIIHVYTLILLIIYYL